MGQWGGRSSAGVAFASAAILGGLIVSLAGGGTTPALVLDLLSFGTAVGALLVMVLAFGGLAQTAWSQAGRALAVSGLTLVLAGDAFQAVATRTTADAGLMWMISFAIRDGIGNGLFYASLLLLGVLLWSQNRWLAGLAAVNGILGFMAMVFAAGLGLPPHLNFMLIAAWFVAMGVDWWRHPSREPADRYALGLEPAPGR